MDDQENKNPSPLCFLDRDEEEEAGGGGGGGVAALMARWCSICWFWRRVAANPAAAAACGFELACAGGVDTARHGAAAAHTGMGESAVQLRGGKWFSSHPPFSLRDFEPLDLNRTIGRPKFCAPIFSFFLHPDFG